MELLKAFLMALAVIFCMVLVALIFVWVSMLPGIIILLIVLVVLLFLLTASFYSSM